MPKIFTLLIVSFIVQADPSGSFEKNYVLLQRKIDTLKQTGEKVSDDTRKEIDGLLAQMNHDHTELKRQIEAHNQQIVQKVEETKKLKEDWVKRVTSAYQEVAGGLKRAWGKLNASEEE